MALAPGQDLSKKLLESVQGYPRLAHHFACMPETASYRNFADMGNLVLLYKQAQLVELEESLSQQIIDDSKAADVKRKLFAVDWIYMRQVAHNEGNSEEYQKQSKLLDDSSRALKEYYEFFRLMTHMTAIAQPRKSDSHYLQWWLQDPDNGDFPLKGDDSNTWGSLAEPDSGANDLVSVKPRSEDDLFTEWTKSKFIFWFDKHIRRRFSKFPDSHDIFAYEEATIRSYAHAFVMALLSLLLISSMGILHWVRSIEVRLVLIAIFCVTFVICITCVTKARRNEIFSAVLAFAAVELVFVANDNSNNSGANP